VIYNRCEVIRTTSQVQVHDEKQTFPHALSNHIGSCKHIKLSGDYSILRNAINQYNLSCQDVQKI